MREDLRNDVEQLLGDVAKTHRYSMSRIYTLYNEVFGKAELPQSCASCLIRKVNELKQWVADQIDQKPVIKTNRGKQRKKPKRADEEIK